MVFCCEDRYRDAINTDSISALKKALSCTGRDFLFVNFVLALSGKWRFIGILTWLHGGECQFVRPDPIAHCLPITQDAPGFRSLAFWHARLSADDISLIDKADDVGIPNSIGDTVCKEMIYYIRSFRNSLCMHISMPHLGQESGSTSHHTFFMHSRHWGEGVNRRQFVG